MFLAKFNKCNGPDKGFKVVPLAYLLDRNHLQPQNKYENRLKSREEKKNSFFWPLNLLPGLTHMPVYFNIIQPISVIPPYSRLFKPNPVYSSICKPILAYSTNPNLSSPNPNI